MEHEYIAHHILRKNSGLVHLIVSMQSKKHSEDYSKHSMNSEDRLPDPEAPKALVDRTTESRSSQSTRQTSSEALGACRTRLRRARGLVKPGAAGLLTGIESSKGISHGCTLSLL